VVKICIFVELEQARENLIHMINKYIFIKDMRMEIGISTGDFCEFFSYIKDDKIKEALYIVDFENDLRSLQVCIESISKILTT